MFSKELQLCIYIHVHADLCLECIYTASVSPEHKSAYNYVHAQLVIRMCIGNSKMCVQKCTSARDRVNLPTCGSLPKGRDHSHVKSGKHIYTSVLFIVVVVCLCCCLFSFVYISSLELGCGYKFSLCMYMYVDTMGVCVLSFTGNNSH